ncbi:sugar kinase [Streptomyces sp. NPDC058735]|uniref:sugar kinase n=1 Tax=unclassified Streptomyces TaxID=2593676 RepID=UPI0036C37D0A
MTSVAVIGECMLEYLADEPDRVLTAAGDTYNTAVYLARTTDPSQVVISYVTALGDDDGSGAILHSLRAEGIQDALVVRLPDRNCGTYHVHTDATGERSFTYDRSQSAATEIFGDLFPTAIDEQLGSFDVIYLSGITLHIMSATARSRLVACLTRARAHGATIVFDSNYRASAWPSPGVARDTFAQVLDITDIALPSFADEAALHGDQDPTSCARRLAAAGVREIVVKDGSRPACLTRDGTSEVIAADRPSAVVDTTAAGDSFNAAFLAARLAGLAPAQAVRAGHRLAALVVRHRGAIVPEDVLRRRAAIGPLKDPETSETSRSTS